MSTLRRWSFVFWSAFTLLLAGLFLGSQPGHANPPEPQCVCAECNSPCGSGHTATCSSKPKS